MSRLNLTKCARHVFLSEIRLMRHPLIIMSCIYILKLLLMFTQINIFKTKNNRILPMIRNQFCTLIGILQANQTHLLSTWKARILNCHFIVSTKWLSGPRPELNRSVRIRFKTKKRKALCSQARFQKVQFWLLCMHVYISYKNSGGTLT